MKKSYSKPHTAVLKLHRISPLLQGSTHATSTNTNMNVYYDEVDW